MDQPAPESRGLGFDLAIRRLVFLLLALTISYVGYLLIVLGPDVESLSFSDWWRGLCTF